MSSPHFTSGGHLDIAVIMKRRSFVFRQGSSDKFWTVEAADRKMTVTWGPSGHPGRNKTTTFRSSEAAKEASETLAREKLREGYKEVTSLPAKAAKPAKPPKSARSTGAPSAPATRETHGSKKPPAGSTKAGGRPGGRFTTLFEELARDIESNDKVDLQAFRINEPAPPEMIEEAKKLDGGALPAGMEAFYREMNGCKLEWKIVDKELVLPS